MTYICAHVQGNGVQYTDSPDSQQEASTKVLG